MIRFIVEHRDQFGVELLCRVLKGAVSGFLTSRGYRAAKARVPSARRLKDELLVPEIQLLHDENYGVYGVRKMHALLRREGWDIGRDQTARLMTLAGVRGVARSKKVFTTKPDPAQAKPKDLVNRDFTAPAPIDQRQERQPLLLRVLPRRHLRSSPLVLRRLLESKHGRGSHMSRS